MCHPRDFNVYPQEEIARLRAELAAAGEQGGDEGSDIVVGEDGKACAHAIALRPHGSFTLRHPPPWSVRNQARGTQPACVSFHV